MTLRPALTWLALWTLIATAVAAGVLVGSLLATAVSASRSSQLADSPSPSGEMTTERPRAAVAGQAARTERPEPVALRTAAPAAAVRSPSPSASSAPAATPVRIPAPTGRAASATATTHTVADARAYARARLSAREYGCLYRLVQRESRWNPLARNRRSGAFGLAQTYPASRLDAWGDRHDPLTQIRWMLGYLSGRYADSACRALDHAITEGWY